MDAIRFRSLPLVVRISALATWFLAWLLFAELAIDRLGLDSWLPYYRVGNFCPYDIAVIVALALWWIRLSRKDPGPASA